MRRARALQRRWLGRPTTRRSRCALAFGAVLAIAACGGDEPAGDKTPEPTGEALTKQTRDGPVVATVTLVPAEPKLGEPISLTLSVEADDGVAVEMPPFGEALGRFAVVDFTPRNGRTPEGKTVATQTYRLSAPMSGRQRIPPLRIEFVDDRSGQRSEIRELLTDELSIDIESVAPEGDLAGALTPAREQLPLGRKQSWIARWWRALALGVAALGGMVAAMLWFRGSRRRVRITAYDKAIKRLRALEARGLPGKDQADAWYVELSSIVRRYLEDRYGLRAPELTTEEFLRVARDSRELSEPHRAILTSFLEDCDRVKFAGYEPDPKESEQALSVSRTFIEDTRVIEGARVTEDTRAIDALPASEDEAA